MAFVENEKYEGTVSSADFVVSPEKGTGGVFILVSTSEGPLDRTWWVSEKSSPFVKKMLSEAFGITDEQMDNDAFEIREFLKGKQCSVVAELARDSNNNVYKDVNGKAYFTIKFLNPSRAGKKASGQSLKRIRNLLGSGSSSSSGSSQEPPPVDWGDTQGPPF